MWFLRCLIVRLLMAPGWLEWKRILLVEDDQGPVSGAQCALSRRLHGQLDNRVRPWNVVIDAASMTVALIFDSSQLLGKAFKTSRVKSQRLNP